MRVQVSKGKELVEKDFIFHLFPKVDKRLVVVVQLHMVTSWGDCIPVVCFVRFLTFEK
jgi:hypothetical protein